MLTGVCENFADVIYGWSPGSIPIGNWRNGDMLKTEWIKSLVDPLDVPEGREGKILFSFICDKGRNSNIF